MHHNPHPPRARIPAGLIVALGFIALLIVAGLVALFYREWLIFSAASPEVAWLLRFCLFALPISIGTGYAYSGLVIVWRRYADHRYIQAEHIERLTLAQRSQGLPATVQSLSYHDSHKELPAPPLALPEPPALAIPTFATMLDQNLVGAGRKLVLGYDEGGVLEGDWTDLYSSIVAGMSGQGKTTSQRFYACQTALHGARFACIDPHYGAGPDSLGATLEPLGAAFLCPIASDEKDILNTVRHIADIGAQRVKGIDKGETKIILWVDELTALLGRSAIGDELAALLERIAQEYRKKNVFVSASGQIWTASRATSELRDSFASVLCHRMKRGQARMLLPTEEAPLVERLSPGRAVLWRTSGATSIVGIPNTTEADVRRVATLIGGQTPTVSGSIPATTRVGMGFHPAPKTEPLSTQNRPSTSAAPTQAQSGQSVTVEGQRAYMLFFDVGKDMTEIVYMLRGVRPKDAAKYQQALREIQALIRAVAQQKAGDKR